jgi:hypothetical protein
MPKTFPTIVAPLPHDPRVMSLAKSVGLTRREAFGAAAEAWAWMSVMAVNDIVVNTAPDSLDAVVDVDGFGDAMFQAGLVGVVNDGLVLPAELRHQQRDERGGVAAPAEGQRTDERARRRKEQNRAASRRYRKTNRVTGANAKPKTDKAWRSLGRVAGHEVRVFDGPHGCYAMVLGATVGGEPCRKLTAGDKAWSLESVKLTDALPLLVAKWKSIHEKEKRRLVSAPIVPSYVDFRDDAERLAVLAKLSADTARHADGADASSRHADASAPSAGPSADRNGDSGRKSVADKGLDASAPSADRHADALSSMSCLSKSSSKEEDMREEGRKAAGNQEPDQGDAAKPEGMAEWEERKRQQRTIAERFAAALNEDVQTILQRWKCNAPYLRLQLEAAGIDPKTGLPAGAHHESADARNDIGTTTEPIAGDKPAEGSVGARGAGKPDDAEGNDIPKVERLRRSCGTLLAAREAVADFRLKQASDIGAADTAEQLRGNFGGGSR